jgi:hypothetical protein
MPGAKQVTWHVNNKSHIMLKMEACRRLSGHRFVLAVSIQRTDGFQPTQSFAGH